MERFIVPNTREQWLALAARWDSDAGNSHTSPLWREQSKVYAAECRAKAEQCER